MGKIKKYKEAWGKSDGKCIFCGKPIPYWSIHHLFRDRKNDTHLVPACWGCHTAFHNATMDMGKAITVLDNFFPNELFLLENNKIRLLTKTANCSTIDS